MIEFIGLENLQAIVGIVISLASLSIGWVSAAIARRVNVERTANWLMVEEQLRRVLISTLGRAAENAVNQNLKGVEAKRFILNHTAKSIPETLAMLKTTADSKVTQNLAEDALGRALKNAIAKK